MFTKEIIMKISTEIYSTAIHVGEEKAIELIAKAGFDAWDFSMFEMFHWDYGKNRPYDKAHPLKEANYLKFARKLKQIGLDNGIVCNQSHAPFPVGKDCEFDYLRRAIECTAEAGGEICVIHPNNNKNAQENKEMYLDLLPFAKEHNVKIATENMWNWDGEKDQASFAACATPKSFNEHLNAVNDDYFVACLDLGHAEMKGIGTSAPEMIEALGDKLQALHIHDNDRWHDSHQIPFSMDMDFVKIAKALKKVNYKGYLTLEADRYLSAFNSENLFEGIKNLAESARKLEKLIKE